MMDASSLSLNPDMGIASALALSSSAHQLPTLNSACRAAFQAEFAPSAEARLLEVLRDGQFVAQLPVVLHKTSGLRVARLPVNPWMKCGDLTVSPIEESPWVFRELARQLNELPVHFLEFEWIEANASWMAVSNALRETGCFVAWRPMFDVGLIRIEGSFESYWQTRSKGFRKKVSSRLRRLSESGTLRLDRYRGPMSDKRRTRLLDEALAIEAAGWKGSEGTAIQCHAGAERLFRNVATILDSTGEMEFVFLRLDDKAIAFELGYRAGRTYHSHKIGFLPEFSRYSPGQLLMYLNLQDHARTGDVDCVDTMGVLSDATRSWMTETRTVQRMVASRNRWLDRQVWRASERIRPLVKRLLHRFR